ncbi:MAG: hypothetical protein R3B82_25740 [Sandaracinaceae bacterium]
MISAEALTARLEATGVPSELAAWCAERRDAGDPTELLQLLLLRQLQAAVRPARGPAAARLLAAGVSPDDLAAAIRESQESLLSAVCAILDGGGRAALEELGLPGEGWAVVASDPRRAPRGSLVGLASTLAQLAPSGAGD